MLWETNIYSIKNKFVDFVTNPGRHMGGSSKEVRTGLFQGSNMGSTPVPPTTVKQASRDDGIGSTPYDSMTNYC